MSQENTMKTIVFKKVDLDIYWIEEIINGNVKKTFNKKLNEVLQRMRRDEEEYGEYEYERAFIIYPRGEGVRTCSFDLFIILPDCSSISLIKNINTSSPTAMDLCNFDDEYEDESTIDDILYDDEWKDCNGKNSRKWITNYLTKHC